MKVKKNVLSATAPDKTSKPAQKSARRAGRKARYASYRATHRREKNKLRRIRQSSGLSAAISYAREHGIPFTVA